MAKIMVTTDDGELIELFTDEDSDDPGESSIGDITKSIARSSLMREIDRAVKLAREKDRRKPSGAR